MSKTMKNLAVAGLFAGAVTLAHAQDPHAGHSGQTSPAVEAAIELPPICKVEAAEPTATPHAMPMPAEPTDADPARQALVGPMAEMHDTMMRAMSADDFDVAFVCGMIPHHQGAIAMARAEIENGDDPWAKELAEQVIAAQEQEIADMLKWLEEQEQ